MHGYSVVALRYASSILELARERNEVDAIYSDMLELQSAFSGSEELRSFLRSPVINIHTKQTVLEKVFSGKVNKLTMLFLKKLADSRRERYIGEIAGSFISQYKKLKNVVIAEVISASKLDDKLREEVRRIVKANPEFAHAGTIELDEKVDKNLIGGLVIRVEDKQVDASFARKIKDYKRSFEENPYVKEF